MAGMLNTSEKAFTVAIPILIPVKEPGPISETNKSILEIVRFVV